MRPEGDATVYSLTWTRYAFPPLRTLGAPPPGGAPFVLSAGSLAGAQGPDLVDARGRDIRRSHDAPCACSWPTFAQRPPSGCIGSVDCLDRKSTRLNSSH